MNEYVPKKHLLFYFFLIDFSPFTTGCDYRNYENDINIFFLNMNTSSFVNKYK